MIYLVFRLVYILAKPVPVNAKKHSLKSLHKHKKPQKSACNFCRWTFNMNVLASNNNLYSVVELKLVDMSGVESGS